MEEKKTPVIILQELIAVLTTRKEPCENIIQKNPRQEGAVNNLKSCNEQSTQYINELMSELSEYGDAVMGEVDRNNKYHDLWYQALTNFNSTSELELLKIFEAMEGSLAELYRGFADVSAELPLTLQETLTKQTQGLALVKIK